MNTNMVTESQTISNVNVSDTDISIRALVYMLLLREGESANHMLRMQGYVNTLANALKRHHYFEDYFENEQIIDTLKMAAVLHDIGNTGIPDRILLKPGPLTYSEFNIIKSHPKLGLEILTKVENDLGKATPLIKIAKEIVYCHHERWDGSGYPDGIIGEAIPISARIAMITDVYDALVTRRVYKPALPHQQAVELILSQRGKLFDPVIVDVFETVHEEFHRIALTHTDTVNDFKKKIDFLELAICEEP